MTLNRVLALTSVALAALLVTQVVRENMPKQPRHLYHASWVNNANTAEDGKAQSDHVVQANVIGLEKGPDIVLTLPQEPDGEDRIPTTIVKLQVVKTYKGNKVKDEVVELLQTGNGSNAVIQPAPPDADEALPGKGNATTPVTGKSKKGRTDSGSSTSSPAGPTSKESRSTILEDDPPYQIGEKYVLFLKNIDDGSGKPPGALGVVNPGTTRALAPEGRYQITKQDRLKPSTTKKGFAPNWQGKHISELENAINAAP